MSDEKLSTGKEEQSSISSSSLNWINSYDGERIEYMADGVGCVKCDNHLKFFSEDGTKIYFSSVENGICSFATHKTMPIFAYSENIPNAKICIIKYPNFDIMTELRGENEVLGYPSLEFSSANLLASISGIPMDELIIWKFPEGIKMYSCKVAHSNNYILMFNPVNVKQIAMCSDKELTIWTLSESVMKRNILLPNIKTGEKSLLEEYVTLSGYSTNDFIQSLLNLPRSCIVNLMGEELEEFEEDLKSATKPTANTICWSPDGILFIGCQQGEIFRVNVDKNAVVPLTFDDSSLEVGSGLEISSKHIKSMAIYKKLLVIGGEDGVLRFYELMGIAMCKLIDMVPLNQTILSITLLPAQGKMYIGTEEGSLLYSYLNNPKKIMELFSFENSFIISMGVLPVVTPTYITLKSSGLLNVWNSDGALLSSLRIKARTNVTSMGVSGLLNLVAVGTTSGYVYLGLFVNFDDPKWLIVLKIHVMPVKSIKFFKGGKYFVVGYEDGHVFINNGIPSQNFTTIGYLEVGGDVKALSTFETEKKYSLGILSESGNQQYITLSSYDKDWLSKKPDYMLTKLYKFKNEMTNKVTCPLPSPAIDLTVLGLDKVVFFHTNSSIISYKVDNYDSLKTSYKTSGSSEVDTTQYDEEVDVAPLSPKPSEHLPRRETMAIMTESMKSRRVSVNVQRRKISTLKEKKESIVFTQFTFPEIKEEEYVSELREWKRYGSHKLLGTSLGLSFDEQLMFSCGQDGAFKIFDVESTEVLWSVSCINFWSNGINTMAMSLGSQYVICSGYSKIFCCIELGMRNNEGDFFPSTKTQASLIHSMKQNRHNEQMEFGRLVSLSSEDLTDINPNLHTVDKIQVVQEIKKAIQNDEIYSPNVPRPDPAMPWFNKRCLEALEDEEFICSNFKMLLRTRITHLRRQLKKMMKENEELEGLEKIPLREFDLDVEEQKLSQAIFEAEVQKMKDEREQQNKHKKRLVNIIKKECWDEMHVKGRGIKAFLSDSLVHNYPLRERSNEEIRELEIVSAHRRVEIAEQHMRLKIGENALLLKKSKHSDKSEDDYEKDDNVFERRSHNALSGSLGSLFGGESDLFYNQFELCTKHQKIKQIVLLKDSIHRIKVAFNKDFDAMLALKGKNILSIKEKNQRIRKIMKDINLSEVVVDPDLSTYEKPEMLFFTSDEEVRVEKFLTPEEWKKQEEEKKIDEERKLREKKDNWRERGLEMMMGGVLEIKKEDELKKEIPVPAFMLEKVEDKWTDEEKTIASEYRAQIKFLEEEREKFKKFQEVELKKLQAFVSDTMQEFDVKLSQLITRKILVQSAIYQEELMLFRLRHSILLEEQLNLKESQLVIQLENAKEKSNQKLMSVMQAKKNLDEAQSVYETHIEEDKLHERMFKKEFHEVPHNFVEPLFKHYKKRPKKVKTRVAEESKESLGVISIQGVSCVNEDCISYVTNLMAELDSSKNMPEGLNPIFWDQLCHYRHEKVIKELMLKNEASQIISLQSRVASLQSIADRAKQKIEDVFNNINQLNLSRHHLYRNLEVQLLLKQGQVEVEITDFLPIYRTSLLLHREVVEELNKSIKALGENKIATMIESKSFKKEISQLEWEHKKMEMELQDLKNKMKDIANFKVTKEVLFFLNKENYDELKNQEVLTLEKTINLTKEFHKKKVESMNEKLATVEQSIQNIQDQNNKMTEDLKQLNDTILERKHIRDVVVEKSGMAKSEKLKRHRSIVKKSKLLELAKNQVKEIKSLKEEIESLKTKTFPMLPAAQKKL